MFKCNTSHNILLLYIILYMYYITGYISNIHYYKTIYKIRLIHYLYDYYLYGNFWNSFLSSFTTQSRILMTLYEKLFENIVGKGKKASSQHFLHFPQCFLLYQRQKSLLKQQYNCRLQMLSIWSCPKFCHLVKELTLSQTTNFTLYQTDRLCRLQFQI